MASRAHAVPPALLLGAVALLGSGRAAADGRVVARAAREVVRVEIEVPEMPARAGAEVPITLRVLDRAGAPVDATRVTLDCITGSVGALARSGEGVHRATLTVPRQLPRARAAVLLATADGRTTERAVPLAPGPARSVEISGPAAVTPRQREYLTVAVLDDFGNGAEEEPRARARTGAVAVKRIDRGLWTLSYAPRVEVEGVSEEDEVVVEAGEARGRRRIRVAPAAGRLSVAPWTGVALGRLSAFAAGTTASAWWLAGSDELGIALDVAWWRLSERSGVSLAGTPAAFTLDRSYLPLTASLAWDHALTRRLVATASAGAGVALVSASARLSGQPTVDERGWAPAGAGAVQLGYRAGGGAAFLQARAAWTGDARLSTVAGSSRALLLVGGYRFDAR